MIEHHQHAYEDEIDLRDLILTVWRGRWIIIGAVAVAVIVAFVYATFVRERVYEAEISCLEFRLADGRSLNPSHYLCFIRSFLEDCSQVHMTS